MNVSFTLRVFYFIVDQYNGISGWTTYLYSMKHQLEATCAAVMETASDVLTKEIGLLRTKCFLS
jgi:hypothetical protein